MRNVFLIGICACGLSAAADAPYSGKWKMNAGKSNFGETTVTYEQMSGGEMKWAWLLWDDGQPNLESVTCGLGRDSAAEQKPGLSRYPGSNYDAQA